VSTNLCESWTTQALSEIILQFHVLDFCSSGSERKKGNKEKLLPGSPALQLAVRTTRLLELFVLSKLHFQVSHCLLVWYVLAISDLDEKSGFPALAKMNLNFSFRLVRAQTSVVYQVSTTSLDLSLPNQVTLRKEYN
jgi:hypothetical protein